MRFCVRKHWVIKGYKQRLNFCWGIVFIIDFVYFSSMITEHFYIHNTAARFAFTKVKYDDVIMVYSDGDSCYIYMTKEYQTTLGPSNRLRAGLPIADCYIKYFRGAEEFIRASSNYIVNINHIIGANKSRTGGYLDLEMTNGNKASLRMTHLYGQKILRSGKKATSLAGIPRMTIDSVKKDEIILEYPNPLQARKKIKEDLGEKVSVPYIRSRMKILSSYE